MPAEQEWPYGHILRRIQPDGYLVLLCGLLPADFPSIASLFFFSQRVEYCNPVEKKPCQQGESPPNQGLCL